MLQHTTPAKLCRITHTQQSCGRDMMHTTCSWWERSREHPRPLSRAPAYPLQDGRSQAVHPRSRLISVNGPTPSCILAVCFIVCCHEREGGATSKSQTRTKTNNSRCLVMLVCSQREGDERACVSTAATAAAAATAAVISVATQQQSISCEM